MTIFDLLFLLVLLISVLTLLSAAILGATGRGRAAVRVLKIWGISAAGYVAVAVISGFALPLKTYHLGDEQCDDDWCLTVDSSRTTGPDTYEVTYRMISRARRVDQRNGNGLAMFMTDSTGRRYPAQDAASATPFDVLLHPSDSVVATRTFKLPAGEKPRGVVVVSKVVGWLPIIGREPFQKTEVLLSSGT
jgi:hypothetical protein